MNCTDAERMVQKYINQTLTMEELEAFIEHVKQCPACYEELETYFTVSTAMQHLDGDMDETKTGTMDMNHLLQMDLKRREAMVRRHHLRKSVLAFFFCLLLCALIGVTVWMIL